MDIADPIFALAWSFAGGPAPTCLDAADTDADGRHNLTDAIFRQPARYETPMLVSLLVLACLVVVSLSVLERRVRGVEVVS